jgi:hypothetical protein
VYTRIDRGLADLAREVARQHPELWSSFSRLRSDIFPFRANVSFGRGNPATADEDVVVSVSGHVDGDTLRMHSDVSRGDGYLDGPTVIVPVSEAKENLVALLESWLTRLEVFLREEATPCPVSELELGGGR